jgi:hypothetical protein
MRLRRLREDDIPDGSTLLVRGGELDQDVLTTDALRYHAIYGTYGVSVFAVRDLTLDEMAQQVPLVRFRILTLLTAGALSGCGVRLEPTGRNVRHYTISFDDLAQGVKALVGAEHRVMTNPYYGG